MVEPSDVIFEERDEFMVSSTNENPVFRTAHFLKPSASKQRDGDELLSHHFLCKNPTISEQKGSKVKVRFRGWRDPKEVWRSWVESMENRCQSTWKKAGIHEAIMGSVYKIKRERDFVLWLAEKWCPETNTFIFPWGEATLTLEDMKVLGGFPVLGESVLTQLDDQESAEIEKKLIQGAKDAATRGSRGRGSGIAWLRYFMGSGSNLEHVAFLSLWLSWFVFPTNYINVGRHIFPIAIRLARGTQIALAPAVLSSLYKELRMLKEKLGASKELIGKGKSINAYSAFQLVQLWGWERFPNLGPEPMSLTDTSKPRQARWHNLRAVPILNFSSAIDSAGDSFKWRPYASSSDSWLLTKFNLDEEQWVLVDLALDEELESLARCLRVSELVGLNCIEQYFPYRVSRQFGMDQDVPLLVARCNWTRAAAWSNYNRPIRDGKLYIPSRHFDSGVTIQYLKWWNHSLMKQGNRAIKPHVKSNRNTISCCRRIGAENEKMSLADSVLYLKRWNHSVMKQGDDVIEARVKKPRNTLRRPRTIGAENQNMTPAFSTQKCRFRSLQTMEAEDSSTRGQEGPQESVAADNRIAEEIGTTRPAIDPITSVSKTAFCADDVSKEAENMSPYVIDLTNEENEAEIQVMREIPGLKLEARIRRLERVLKFIKKTKYPHLCKDEEPI